MVEASLITGQLQKSKIANCPVFIPAKLSDNLASELCINTKDSKLETGNQPDFSGVFNLYFHKFFAGNMSLMDGFSDLPLENLYLWSGAKTFKDVHVKQVINDINKFDKVLGLIKSDNLINKANLAKYNKLLQPKKREFKFRKGEMRVGNPANVDYAFYAPPIADIDDLLADVFDFIHSEKVSMLNTVLIAMFQLAFIHPFVDGNGRVIRAFALLFVQKELNVIAAYLLVLFFKVINPINYYLTLKAYREGDLTTLKNFHQQAIEWTNQSIKILSSFIEEYTNKVGQLKINTDDNYSQVVIKTDSNQKIDGSVFQFHSKKAGKSIYVNTALLNALNQFDYYLRYELRKHQSN